MTGRALIIIDEPAMAEWLPRRFAQFGWKTISASDEAEALRLTESEAFDVVIADAVLGQGDGFALIEDIKRLQPKARLVCTSARAGPVARLKALAAGADAYLPKPFSLADFDRAAGLKGGES